MGNSVMNHRTLLLITFIITPIVTFGQVLVTGRVVDADTKKPIKEATVILDGTAVKTVTNVLGYFQLTADSTSKLVIQQAGYETGVINVPSATSFQIQLIRDRTPGFGNGIHEFYAFLSENLSYPAKARNSDTQGIVYVSFDLDSIRGMQNVTLVRDIGNGCGGEVVKVLRKVPHKWIPKSRSVTLILPVIFKIGTKNLGLTRTDIELPKGKVLTEVVVSVVRLR